MSRLPQRPRQHVIEEESREFVKQILPAEWIVQDGQKDYGIDFTVEIVLTSGKSDDVTGAVFLMQLKGTDHLRTIRAQYVTYLIKTSSLRYYLERPELVVFLVYDAKEEVGYWIWIQDYIRERSKSDWPKQKTVTVRIPINNRFDAKAVGEIAQRVLRFHEPSKWLSAVETAQNPQYRYSVRYGEKGVVVSIYPRYPGAERDSPAELNLILNFDQTDPIAQAKLEAVERHVKTGEPVEIESRFIEKAEFPKAWSDLWGYVPELPDATVVLSTAQSERVFRYRLTILGQNDEILGEIPQVNFRVVQGGTEEVTLSSEGDDPNLVFRLRFNHAQDKAFASIRFNFVGTSAVVVRKLLTLQAALARGISMALTSVTDETTVFLSRYATGQMSTHEPGFIELIDDLVFIQQKTGELIRWRGQVDFQEQAGVRQLVEVLKTGHLLQQSGRFKFVVAMPRAAQMLDEFSKSEQPVTLEFPDDIVVILDTRISLGPGWVEIPKARLSDESIARLHELNRTPEDALVSIELIVEEQPISLFYSRWLPQLAGENTNRSEMHNP